MYFRLTSKCMGTPASSPTPSDPPWSVAAEDPGTLSLPPKNPELTGTCHASHHFSGLPMYFRLTSKCMGTPMSSPSPSCHELPVTQNLILNAGPSSGMAILGAPCYELPSGPSSGAVTSGTSSPPPNQPGPTGTACSYGLPAHFCLKRAGTPCFRSLSALSGIDSASERTEVTASYTSHRPSILNGRERWQVRQFGLAPLFNGRQSNTKHVNTPNPPSSPAPLGLVMMAGRGSSTVVATSLALTDPPTRIGSNCSLTHSSTRPHQDSQPRDPTKPLNDEPQNGYLTTMSSMVISHPCARTPRSHPSARTPRPAKLQRHPHPSWHLSIWLITHFAHMLLLLGREHPHKWTQHHPHWFSPPPTQGTEEDRSTSAARENNEVSRSRIKPSNGVRYGEASHPGPSQGPDIPSPTRLSRPWVQTKQLHSPPSLLLTQMRRNLWTRMKTS